MAHPDASQEAAPKSEDQKFDELADFLGADEEQEEEEGSPEGDDLPNQEEEIPDDEAQDEEDEPEAPAIDFPVSWGADAKESFSQLPSDLQQAVATREAQRERFIQDKATEAARAQETVKREATRAVAEYERHYASELSQYVEAFQPQRPDPRLITVDPQQFYALQAEYEQAIVQRQSMAQQATHARQQAEARDREISAAEHAEEQAELAQAFTDWHDPAKRIQLLTTLETVGATLGYTREAMENAGAADLKALHMVSGLKAKADKWDALQKGKMETVRSAKALPRATRPGAANSRGDIGANRADAAWQRVKGATSKEHQADAFADYLTKAGHL